MKTTLAILFALSLGMSAVGDEKAKKRFEAIKADAEKGDAILKNLRQVQLSNQARSRDAHHNEIRRVIHQFEELSSMGTNAFPAIKKFFSHKMDFEYRENAAEIVSGNWSQGQIYPDPIFPPSLRIGLLNTVRRIGKRDVKATAAAERVLLGVLKKTQRAVEVAYIAQALEDLSPEVNKEAYLLSTRKLLSLPILEEGREASWLDRQNRGMLFNILRQHKDTRFVDQAKTQLVRTDKQRQRDGKEIEVTYIDRSVLGYLTGVLGSKSMPFLRDVYDNAELDDRNRTSIRGIAAGYIGISADADIIINSRMAEGFQMLVTEGADVKKQKENRDRGLSNISYYLSKLGEGRNVPAETLQARQRFLSSLRTQTADKQVLGWMDNTQQRLNDMSDPEKAKKLDSRFDSRRSASSRRR